MQPNADPERPRTVRQTALVDLSKDLPRRLDRVAGGGGIVERRAKYGHKAVTQEFVDEAPVAVDCFDHECKVAIEKLDHCLGWAAARVFGEVTDVEKHHADLAGVDFATRTHREKPDRSALLTARIPGDWRDRSGPWVPTCLASMCLRRS